ncbi:Crp/Fnr family transcriptional regulator [Paractinoplanes deccanensis]|uniref:Crp/Fnr family transcriptional regulator n=1 Tax=Paractinoplanes deccanensis TaxID=113561 RepID=A0ABQ3YI61_9ACTN|nr:Crp/Fnr family transcriptional regulator [Actinoplanes deccanensis]GID79672.1 Crp/Fnr family transcriptional regulator [Actinoplanes deccanensis]
MPDTKIRAWPPRTFMARLSPPTAAALLRLGTEQRLPTGRILMREGEHGSYVALIRRGVVKVTAEMPDGRPALLSIRVAGDLVGEMGALNQLPRSATVTMCGPGTVRLIQVRDFAPFLTSHPPAAVALAATVGERLRWSNRRRIDFTSYPVKTRLARILTELADFHGLRSREGALEIGIRLTQPELATLCGAAEISVHKALRDMRRSHLVSSRYGRIIVWDLSGLRDRADAAP